MRKLILALFAALLLTPAASVQAQGDGVDFSTFADAEALRDAGTLDTLTLDYLDRLPSGEFVFYNAPTGDLVGYDNDASEGGRTRIIRSAGDLQDDLGSDLTVDDLDAASDGNVYVLARDADNNNQIYKTSADGSSESVLGTIGGTDAIEVVGETVYLGIIGAFTDDKQNSIYSISTTGTGQSATEVLSNSNFNPDNQLEAGSGGDLYFLSNPNFSSAPFDGGALVRVNDPAGDAPSAEALYKVFANGPFSDTGNGIGDVAVTSRDGSDRIYLYNASFDGENGEEFGFFQGDGSGSTIYATESDVIGDSDADNEITGARNPLYVDAGSGEQYVANRAAFGGANEMLQISGAPPADSIATVTFEDNTLGDGQSVAVASTSLPEDGYVAIHDASLLGEDGEPFTDDDQPLSSVIGVSQHLEAGDHSDLDVTLFDVPGADFPADTSLSGSPTLIAMPHQETSGNQQYNFLTSEGSEDGPYVNDNGNPVVQASTLPVEFAAAPTAAVEDESVTLSWKTLSETNNEGFRVQHRRAEGAPSSPGWTTASEQVDGAGTTTAANTYAYTVSGLAPGRYVFRVKQIDADGGASFSETVEAQVGAGDFALSTPTKNPFRGQTTLSYRTSGSAEVEAVLYNSLGQQVRELNATGGRITVEAAGLSSGLYFVRLATKGGERADTQAITLVR
jgi:hypothetical protein